MNTSTNVTPHERLFNYVRRSSTGATIPSWLCNPGPVLLKRHVRASKTDPLVDEVELLQASPYYAHIRYPDGKEDTVFTRHLAPTGNELKTRIPNTDAAPDPTSPEVVAVDAEGSDAEASRPGHQPELENAPVLRRSERIRHPPIRFEAS